MAKGKIVTCPQCGADVDADKYQRCPRCNHLLLHGGDCTGCGKCLLKK
ncbi:hypothetical protein MFMK1_002319 [Metallumcola ferriviriculae]|uniref:DUF7577 domain-containing protein n=1 Tax=Metallumcola ferriviriculae TaxID=3039180 RepID=A0AAU0UPG1_9FIRM|nr:hypothetical protein MFMK1_002319 [Desulfitibacteraceae bacterium MK1]